jgi:hypothetical protein
MPTAPNGDRETTVPPIPHRGHHIRNPRAPYDQRRMLVERAIPDLPTHVIAWIFRTYEISSEGGTIDLN